MCGIPKAVVRRAEEAAKAWEHTSKLQDKIGEKRGDCVPLGLASDVAWILKGEEVHPRGLEVLKRAIEVL